MRQALNLLSTWGLSQLPVIDGDDCVGSVTEGLMARVLEDGKLLDRPVSEVMAAPFPVVDADVPLDRLVTLLSKETPAALVRDGRPPRRHRQPLRRAAPGGRDRLRLSGLREPGLRTRSTAAFQPA